MNDWIGWLLLLRRVVPEREAGDATTGELCRPLALVLADLDDRIEAAGAGAVAGALDDEEVAAVEGVRSALLECAAALLGGGGVGGGESDGGGSWGQVEERKSRKTLMKAVGKKVEKKHRGNRAEALAVVGVVPPAPVSMPEVRG